MDYELAKELRDSGFPNIQDVQHRQGREFLAPDGRMPVYSLGEMAPTGDGTEEQNLNERGDPAARIKKNEVDAAFGKQSPKK